jgi:XTP/dITP diphosphohydrolase
MRLVLATANRGKQREFATLLAARGYELLLQSELGIDSPAETGATFLDNALIKARHAARRALCPALADDSGIEVEALQGRPGVRSARYAGEQASDADNLQLLLRELQDVPDAQRGARYRCAIVLLRDAHDAAPLIAEGVWAGHIARAPRGDGGFGYDSVFVPGGAGQPLTAAQMPPAAKNALSHRALALAALLAQLDSR